MNPADTFDHTNSTSALTVMDGDVPDASLSVDELGSAIVAQAGRLAAATCRWLLLVADFDARDGHARMGMASTAQWLCYACGMAQRTAVDHVRVARALAAHPRLAEEMSDGRLSYSHVRAISRIVEPGCDRLVEDLINLANHGTVHQLESTVRGLRDVTKQEEQREEYARTGWTRDSQWRLTARLDPERGAVVTSALRAVAQAEGLALDDALVRLAEIGLATVTAAAGGELPGLRGDERAAVVIHLDATSSGEPARPRARIANGPGLPDEVVQRLLCAGRIRTAVRGKGGDVLNLGRSHRLVSSRQFKALLLRDGGRCTHPGCTNRRKLEAHHVVHWLDGGATDMANLVLLCPRHHHLHHDGAFTVHALGRGRFAFRLADGTDLPAHVDPAEHIRTTTPLEAEFPDVAAAAATSKWDGTRLDRDLAVWGMAQQLPRSGSAEPDPAERPNANLSDGWPWCLFRTA